MIVFSFDRGRARFISLLRRVDYSSAHLVLTDRKVKCLLHFNSDERDSLQELKGSVCYLSWTEGRLLFHCGLRTYACERMPAEFDPKTNFECYSETVCLLAQLGSCVA